MREATILRTAVFDSKLKFYWWLQGILFSIITFIGILILPIWLLGFGQYVCRRAYENMKYSLTERELHVRKGYVFRVEKNIPLDKIQDLTVHEGPILRWLGLASLKVQTRGRPPFYHCPDSRGWITEAFLIRIDAPDYSCDVVPSGWVEDSR